MSLSFKKFVELIDQENELSEEQIQEIFGVFSTSDSKQQAIAKQKSAEFAARRDALKKKAAGGNTASDDEDEDNEDDPRRLGAIKTKSGQPGQQKTQFVNRDTLQKNKDSGTRPFQSAAAKGNAAERDWLANMESVVTEAKRYATFDEWDENYSKDINSAFEAWMSERKKKQLFKLYQEGKKIKSLAFADAQDNKDKIKKAKDKAIAQGWTVFAEEDNLDSYEIILVK